MMNSHQSSRKKMARYLLVLPLALGLLSFSAPQAASGMLSLAPVAAPVATDVEQPASISALPPAALAHIVKQYPGYRLISVAELRSADGSNLRYKVEIAIGRRPEQVVFDAQGKPVAQAAAVVPLYYVDGQLVSKEEVDTLDPKLIATMNVVKGETGDKVLIITKKNSQKAGAATPGSKPDLAKALILVNGKEMTAAQLEQIPAENIITMEVVKGPDAEQQYGAKGREGVIIVRTK